MLFNLIFMKVNIIVFGQLRDILGDQLELDEVLDIDEVKNQLHEKYPEMIESNYLVALNKKLVTGNMMLNDNSTVAILSAFSGG